MSTLYNTMTKAAVLRLGDLVCRGHYPVRDLLELTFHQKYELAFRASWTLEQVVAGCFDVFSPSLEDFLARYPLQTNTSCRRHYAKILVCLFERGAVGDYDPEPVTEATFDWLIDPETPVAVKVHCIEALLHLSKELDWVGPELKAQTEFLMEQGSPGMRSRGRKILARLRTDGTR